jgi:regulator of RNase E activity RraA
MTGVPENLRQLLTSAVLADVLDGLGHRNTALPPQVRPLRDTWKVFGPAATLRAEAVTTEPLHPYAIEMECIDKLRPGEVLVAATGGDVGSALWGELLSTAARARGAVGAITDGATRDASRILTMDFPVFAGGFCPLDSKGRLDGVAHGEAITIGICVIHPGDWVFADIDGIVVAPRDIAREAVARALEKVTGENRVRDELARGRSLREVFAEYRIL